MSSNGLPAQLPRDGEERCAQLLAFLDHWGRSIGDVLIELNGYEFVWIATRTEAALFQVVRLLNNVDWAYLYGDEDWTC
jgi:hypothetical protein